MSGSPIDQLPPHLHHVLGAVHSLYYDPDPAAKKQADQGLKEFQKTKQAWQTSHDILQLTEIPPEAVWFAANTLYNKVSFSYCDLGTSDRFPFRDAVLSHLSRHIKGSEIVLTQLALSVAALAVQMQEWEHPVEQLVTMLNGGHGDTAHALLHILTVLPEECDTISRRYRQAGPRALSLCTSVGAKVLLLLSEFLRRSNDQRIHRMVLRCLLSWVRYAFAAVSEATVLSSTILGDCFQAASVSDISDVACDVISAFIIFAEQHNLESLRQLLAGAVFQLWPQYRQLQSDDDFSQCRSLLQVFMQLAESNVVWILDGVPLAVDLLNLVVNCIPNPDSELSILTFNFWYILAGNMEAFNRGDAVRAARIGPRYQQYFLAAIDNIRDVIQFPLEYDGLSEQDEERKRFRYAAADALLDISSFFNSAVCLEHLVKCMQPFIAEYRANTSQWHRLEACLYSIRSIARNIQTGEENAASQSLLPRVMADLLSMTSHPVLRYTATMIVGRYSDWINAHPESIGPLLSFVVQGLTVPGSQSAAAMAFKFICESCSKFLASRPIDQIIQVYCSMSSLDSDDQNEIIEGVCAVVCSRPAELIPEHLRQLINPVLQSLSVVVSQAGSRAPVDLTLLSSNLDRLAHLFKSIHLDSCPELVAMVCEMWPLLRELLVAFVQDEKTMEKICRLIKFILRATRTDFPVLKELLLLMTQLFPAAPWSCFIYTCSITVDEFSSVPEQRDLFSHVMSAIATKSLSVLSSIEQITENPTICEDYFNFLSRCITDLTGLTIQSGLLQPSLTCAVHAIRIQHREAARAVFLFLRHLLDLGQTRAECQGVVQSLFDTTAPFLFQTLITHLLEDLSRNRMRDLVEVLRAAVNLDRNKSRVFLQQAIDLLPPSVPCKAEFIHNVFSSTGPSEQREAILKFEAAYQEASNLL